MTPAPPTPAPPPADLRCRCGRVLGTADGSGLRLGGIRVVSGGDRVSLNLECPACGLIRRYCVPAYKPARPC